ncbi:MULTISPECIES: tetrahydromethanopterin S-methyltransferase subunit MtrG [Methanococcoides]|jgi:tetrahydromethanopterin S-methyltransferase subunit G|uniref:Tetrahydromethanopterin S-methyltransferase subunit G n=2 Tax=Methanococcoides TaxID=2225 RepID=A0A9E4ZF23_9EURY|nr:MULTISPECIES: tetrahydromethanopterin S-methyltransferase subunit G [Methanococcoides]MCD4806252.1 tetrahydromethanopterin S-methyltransferase subunit G [Methanococcoides sp.]MCM1986452.1 tetrahydromethanopterin S-methyltransferase subunit G [Methanococcoides seepicolus]MDA0524916.1 tetrahydromethanopterin S-methyltransferase subunit G [Methanococcoides alaskense]MDR6222169.1 tetrahydromethanopterin S-methyltransferase subunit G [Methanococcoides alaskense]
MSDAKNTTPSVVTDPADFNEVLEKLNLIDEKIEFVNSEIAQRIGKKLGRDIGIMYGAIAGILIFLIYISLSPILI